MKFYHFGKIVAVHGVWGELVITHSLKKPELLSLCDALLIEVWNESIIPFFIKKIEINQNELYVQLEEINNREEAKKYVQKQVYFYSEDEIAPECANDWSFLLHYKIFSQDKYIGQIVDIVEMNGMYLIETIYDSRKVSLPLHEQLVIDVNNTENKIHLHIPDGLLDIY